MVVGRIGRGMDPAQGLVDQELGQEAEAVLIPDPPTVEDHVPDHRHHHKAATRTAVQVC
jgi:hypothetical protein